MDEIRLVFPTSLYARCWRAGPLHKRRVDGSATAALPARAPAAAGTHNRRDQRLRLRAAPDMAPRVRCCHLWAGARRGVQGARRASADTRVGLVNTTPQRKSSGPKVKCAASRAHLTLSADVRYRGDRLRTSTPAGDLPHGP